MEYVIKSFCSHFQNHSDIDLKTENSKIGKRLLVTSCLNLASWNLPEIKSCLLNSYRDPNSVTFSDGYDKALLVNSFIWEGKHNKCMWSEWLASWNLLRTVISERSYIQTLRPILCSLETRKHSKGNFCQIKEIKMN